MSEVTTAWRIVKARYAPDAFDGEGARLYGGRWNSPGTAVIYTAESRELAMLEILAHLPAAALLALYVCIPVRFEARLVTTLNERELPADWRVEPAPESTRQLGDAWARERRSAVWRVPSAVVPRESSYLLNPAHPDFDSLKIGEPEPIRFDERLLKRA